MGKLHRDHLLCWKSLTVRVNYKSWQRYVGGVCVCVFWVPMKHVCVCVFQVSSALVLLLSPALRFLEVPGGCWTLIVPLLKEKSLALKCLRHDRFLFSFSVSFLRVPPSPPLLPRLLIIVNQAADQKHASTQIPEAFGRVKGLIPELVAVIGRLPPPSSSSSSSSSLLLSCSFLFRSGRELMRSRQSRGEVLIWPVKWKGD